MKEQWIQASEIGNYLYCRRAWWLGRVKKIESINVQELEGGVQYHQMHGRKVWWRQLSERLVYLFLAVAVALFVYWFLIGG